LIDAPDRSGGHSRRRQKRRSGISGTDQDLIIDAAIAAALRCARSRVSAAGSARRRCAPRSWELQLRSFFRATIMRFNHVNPRQAFRGASYRAAVSAAAERRQRENISTSTAVDTALVLGTDYRVIGMGQPYGKAAIAPLYGKAWPVPARR